MTTKSLRAIKKFILGATLSCAFALYVIYRPQTPTVISLGSPLALTTNDAPLALNQNTDPATVTPTPTENPAVPPTDTTPTPTTTKPTAATATTTAKKTTAAAPPQPPTTPATSAPQPTPAPTPMPVKQTGAYTDGQYTGSVANAYYGNVQVKVTVQNGKITSVAFLQYPSDQGTSRYINSQAMPILIQEAIQAQNARVNIVSGASDTSQAFRQSLGVALAKAKI